MAMERPAIVEDKHLTYLDDLRKRGTCNMYGSGAYIQKVFGCNETDANDIVGYWMKTFGDEER
jgi:hypothetical protein